MSCITISSTVINSISSMPSMKLSSIWVLSHSRAALVSLFPLQISRCVLIDSSYCSISLSNTPGECHDSCCLNCLSSLLRQPNSLSVGALSLVNHRDLHQGCQTVYSPDTIMFVHEYYDYASDLQTRAKCS